MTVGDKVYAPYVSCYDTGPLVMLFERTVISVIEAGVVCESNGSAAIYRHGEVFRTREEAKLFAVSKVREGQDRMNEKYRHEIDKLLTADIPTV